MANPLDSVHIIDRIHVNGGNGGNGRHRRSARRHFQNGQRLAALRAITAAKGYLAGIFPTIAVAAMSCGSNRIYVDAALVLLKTEDSILLEAVLAGEKPLVAAADEMKVVATLVSALRQATATDLATLGRIVGPGQVFDRVVVPAL
jgi:hypothetical protein